jgi:hypothetical protein
MDEKVNYWFLKYNNMTSSVSISFNQMQIKNTVCKVINLNNDKIVTRVVIAGSVRYIIDIKVSEMIHNYM